MEESSRMAKKAKVNTDENLKSETEEKAEEKLESGIEANTEEILTSKAEEKKETSSKPLTAPSKHDLEEIKEELLFMRKVIEFINTNQMHFSNKKGFYALQMCVAIIGESARQVLDLLKKQDRYMPKAYEVIPWQALRKFRNMGVHAAHLQDLEKLAKAIKGNIPLLTKHVKSVIEHIEKGKHDEVVQAEPLELTELEIILANYKGKKKQKQQEVTPLDKIDNQIKTLKSMLKELENLKEFIAEDKSQITIYAAQMCMVRIGLAISDRLGMDFQEMYPINISSPLLKNRPITWKYLISQREALIHENYNLDEISTFKIARNFLSTTIFFDKLIKDQEKNLTAMTQQSVQIPEKKTESLTPTPLTGSFKPFTLFSKKTSILAPKPTLFPKENFDIIESKQEEANKDESRQKEIEKNESKEELKK